MAGKFLGRAAVVDLVKSEQAANARRKREGTTHHSIRAVICGCTDPNCGGWHVVDSERTTPTPAEADAMLAADKRVRTASARIRKTNAGRKSGTPD